MTILLVDFSQLVVASVAVNSGSVKGPDIKSLVKHVALNQLLSLKKRFKGKMVLCCDSKSYWRTDEFPAYKGHRVHKKKDSFLDWGMVHESLSELKVELAENFPYVVLEASKCEADDIIAVLCHYLQENELDQTGLFESPADVMICSTDSDFQQLQKYKNVSQWNNVEKKLIKCPNPKQFLLEHILTGDAGDNIPNVCTSTQWSIDRANNVKTKANSFMTARIAEFTEKGYAACSSESEQINFKRNELLVDFDKIPEAIYNRIIETYLSAEVKGTKMKVFNYLTKQRMKLLLGDYASF